jgi:type IV fimbrial biogenesis protein FimT
MALAMPAYRDFINRQQMQAAALEFYAAVNLTRAEAIKRGDQVTMAAADGADWKSGWAIFLDANNNLRRDSGEQIIMTHDALPATLAVANALPMRRRRTYPIQVMAAVVPKRASFSRRLVLSVLQL